MASKSKLVEKLKDGAKHFGKVAGAGALYLVLSNSPVQAQNVFVDTTYNRARARDLARVYSDYLGYSTQLGNTPTQFDGLVVIPADSRLGGPRFNALMSNSTNNVFVITNDAASFSEDTKSLLNISEGDSTINVYTMWPVNHCNETGGIHFDYRSRVEALGLVPRDSFYGELALVDGGSSAPLGVRTYGDGLSKRLVVDVDLNPEFFDYPDIVYLSAMGVSCLDIEGNSVRDSKTELPDSVAMLKSYPNPFNSTTKISFNNPTTGEVCLDVYDILGKRVVTLYEGNLNRGKHEFNFSPKNLPSGVYFPKFVTKKGSKTSKITYLK